jgi:hypothetical protein
VSAAKNTIVDEHEAERDQRVHHPREQPAGQHLEEEDDFNRHWLPCPLLLFLPPP